MKTTTSPPEVRTRAAEATDAPPEIRRRAVRQPNAVGRPAGRPATTRSGTPTTTRTGITRTGSPATGPSATGRAAPTRTPERRATAPARRPVRPVGRRTTTAPQAPFAVLVVGLLGGALVGLLLLNTALAQQAFERSELQRENQRLDERKQALQQDIAREDTPQVLHAKARRLGMRDTKGPPLIDPRVPSAAP